MRSLIVLTFAMLAVAASAIDDRINCTVPRNCGINPQYQWSVEKCKCVKTCYPKTQKDCGNPLDFKLNPITCKCEKNCEPRNCGFNPQYQWSVAQCRCIKTCFPKTQEDCGNPARSKLNPITCKCEETRCQPKNCGINFYWDYKTCSCRQMERPTSS